MARNPAPGDFSVEIDGIGSFVFGRRTPRDAFRIRGEYDKLTGANYDDDGNMRDVTALAYATVSVMAVSVPDGFDLQKLDPVVNDEWESIVFRVFGGFREKELTFRQGSGESSPQPGA